MTEDAPHDLVWRFLPCALLDLSTKRLVKANAAFAALLGVGAAAITGLDFASVAPAHERPGVGAILSAMAAGTVRVLEGRACWQRRDGAFVEVERWLRCVEKHPRATHALVAALPAGPGYPMAPVAPVQGGTHLAVAVLDEHWHLLEVNVDGATWLGLDPATREGRSLCDVLHPDDAPLLWLAAGRSALDALVVPLQVRVRQHDGSWTPVRCEISPLAGHAPARFALVMAAGSREGKGESAARRAADLEDHLWRIGLEVAAAGFSDPSTLTDHWWSDPALRELGQRQLDILRRLVRGERVPSIARELFLSQSTVRNHLAAIYRRFGVHSQAELLAHLMNGEAVTCDQGPDRP